MEIAKFIFACIGSFVTAAGFFGELWAKHQKRLEDKISAAEAGTRERIKTIEASAREEIKEVRECRLHKRVLKAHICLAVRPSFVNKTRCVVLREFPHLSANTIYCEFCGEQNLVRAGSLLRLPSCILCRPQIFCRK